MFKVHIDLENCYGIAKLTHLFEYNDSLKAHLIYAPNGVMKTSFANTIEDICLGRETKDLIYPSRVTKRVVKKDSFSGADLRDDEILVINSYSESYKSENVIVLLADEDLKKEFDRLHDEIENKVDYLFKCIDKPAGKQSSIGLFATDFEFKPKDVNESLEMIYDEYPKENIDDFSSFKYGKLITPDAEKIFSDEKLRMLIRKYIDLYEKLLSESKVFQSDFNHTNAENVLKSLSKDGFFKADHRVVLSGNEVSIGEDEFKAVIQEEKRRIIDNELSAEFNEIDKLLSKNQALRFLRETIRDNKDIIPELMDFEEFKRKLWLSYLLMNYDVFQDMVTTYKANKLRIKEIIEKAKMQSSRWHTVVNEFNSRFNNMPFEIIIVNKEDVVLRSEVPSVTFKYKNRGEETVITEQQLISRLSNGEKKALYLLNILFEIAARKEIGNKTLLVFDDVADSFDYRNKYAIIEYLKDIVEEHLFYPIILTHNFDFYRTVAGRLNIKRSSHFVVRSEDELILEHGQYFENVFDSWRNRVYKDNIIYISAIPFVRNIIEYTKGRHSQLYNQLTNLLHIKNNSAEGIKNTNDILIRDLIDIYCAAWGRDISKFEQRTDESVINLIKSESERIITNDIRREQIEFKITLSMACRLLTEEYMIKRIDDTSAVNQIPGNQTRELRGLITFDSTDEDKKVKEIIDKVLIITSENIHINSFMYEPIVDMSIEEIKRLYLSVKGLSETTVNHFA
ncbi:hypothetical protein QBE53_13060 [Vallitaleaceae bacterium 9-2]